MVENVGRLRGMAWCLVVCLGARGFLRTCRGRGLGVAAGPCLRGFLLRVVPCTLVAPLRRSGGVRGGVVAWAVMLVRVGVSALRLWAEWQGQDDTLWLALTNRQWPPHRTHWQLWLPLP